MIQNHNECVKPKDKVYFLGDFAFGHNKDALNIRKRLNGSEYFFIKGNHDQVAHQIRHTFTWFKDVHMIDIKDQKIWLSHYSHLVWPQMHYDSWMLAGHSHGGLQENESSKRIDVGIDATARRLAGIPIGGSLTNQIPKPEMYRPINFDEIKVIMDKRIFIPVDHHIKE